MEPNEPRTNPETSNASSAAPEAQLAVAADPILAGAGLMASPGAAHDMEREVQHVLENHPSLRFSRLKVHQCGRDSVCLEGYLESNDEGLDLAALVQGLCGINTVVNHVLCPQATPIPKKG